MLPPSFRDGFHRSSSGTKEASGQCIETSRNSNPIPTGATSFCFTNTSTAIRAEELVQAIRPGGPVWLRRCCSRAANRERVRSAKELELPSRIESRTRDQLKLEKNEMKAISVLPGKANS